MGYTAKQDVKIEIKIAKKGMFIFWDDIFSETYTASGEYYYHAYDYDVVEAGNYRCTVTYTVISEDGRKDVITFEDIKRFDGIPQTSGEETTTQETTTSYNSQNQKVSHKDYIYDQNGKYVKFVVYDAWGNLIDEEYAEK